MSHKAGGQHHREHVQGTVWDPTLGPDSTREKEKASVDPSSLPVVVINDSDVETTINFLVAQRAKNLLAMWETQVRSLGQEDPPEKGMATHSTTLAWRIPWTEEPGRLQSMGSQRVRHD